MFTYFFYIDFRFIEDVKTFLEWQNYEEADVLGCRHCKKSVILRDTQEAEAFFFQITLISETFWKKCVRKTVISVLSPQDVASSSHFARKPASPAATPSTASNYVSHVNVRFDWCSCSPVHGALRGRTPQPQPRPPCARGDYGQYHPPPPPHTYPHKPPLHYTLH